MESFGQIPLNHSSHSEKTSRNSTSAADDAEASIHYYDNIINPSSQTNCDRCRKNITSYTHILCDWGDYCVPCFSSLTKFPQEYHVIGHLNFPLIDQRWSANEQLLLFNAMERLGYGNWTDIKAEIGSSKSIQEIEDHTQRMLEISFAQLQMSVNTIKRRQVKDKMEASTQKIFPHKNKYELKLMKQYIQNSQLNNFEQSKMKIVGLTAKRGDFQIEYDNDLQLLIAEMQFLDYDTPQERLMKFKVLDIFNERLNRRNQIKDFTIERKLLDLCQLNKKDRGKSKQERDMAVFLRPYARFISNMDYERLCEGIVKQNQLKQMLSAHKQHKGKGAKNTNNFHHENLSRKRSISTKKRLKSKQDGSKLAFITQEQYLLCSRLKITQISFMMIKSTIESISSKRQSIQAEYFHHIFKINPNVINQIFTYLKQKKENLHRQ